MVIVVIVMVIVVTVIPVVVVVIFAGPIALVHVPAVRVVIPVWVDVEATFKRWAVPVSLVPAIAALKWLPVSLRPGIAGTGSGWARLVAERRRSLAESDSKGDLSVCGRRGQSEGHDSSGGCCCEFYQRKFVLQSVHLLGVRGADGTAGCLAGR